MEIMFHNLELATPLVIVLLVLVFGGATIIAQLGRMIVKFALAVCQNSERDLRDSYSVSHEISGDRSSCKHYVVAMAMPSSIDLREILVHVSSCGEHVQFRKCAGYGSDPLAVPPTTVHVTLADAVDLATPVPESVIRKSSYAASFPPTTEAAGEETDYIPVRPALDHKTDANIRKRPTVSFDQVGNIAKRVKRSTFDLEQADNITKRFKRSTLERKKAGNIRKRMTREFDEVSNIAKRLKRPLVVIEHVSHTDDVKGDSVQRLFPIHEQQSNTSTDVEACFCAAKQGTHSVSDGETFTAELESGAPRLEGNYRLGTRSLLLRPAEWSLRKLKMMLHYFDH